MRGKRGSMRSPDDVPFSEWKTPRFLLALVVTGISILAVTVLAAVIIVRKHDPDAPQNVLNSVLPLLGTWVGTILAYYFSKENFEAATQSVTALAKQLTPQQLLQSTPVRTKMIPRAQMVVQKAPAANLKLTDALNKLEQEKKGNRVPVLGDKDEPKYIVHRSLIDSYLTSLARGGKSTQEITAQTLQNMLDGNADTKRMAESFAVVKEDATLADALATMSNLQDCQDVFVTQTGSKDEPVLGWITNVIIQENAKV
jgi:hypothetical protein